ncbi:hypothetical protein WJX72_005565 [[Myrmecia] bisecta]|uniref:J domain-containing protein n=1 Tax=[Myrmecia] bisecta TaxID=41462 RepID=A0AAW1PG97_9CHLO
MFSTLLQDIGEPVQLDHRDEPGGMLAQRLQLLSQNLEVVEAHARMLAGRVETAEAETRDYADMLAEANELIRHMVAEEEGRHSDQQLQDEVNRLRDTLEATQLQAAVTEGNLRRMLAEERLQTEHMRLMQAETSMQRDEALGDLAEAYADIEALHATLADTAEYVHHLRSRALELELQNCVVSSRAARAEALAEAQTTSGWLSLDKTRHAIVEAVQEASRLPLGQRKQKIRQLQLRWHPDKNPVLKEFATEVTKLINEAIAQMPEAPPPSEPEHAAASAAGAQQPAAQQRSEERGPAGPSPRQSSDRPTSAAYAQDSAPAPQPSEGSAGEHAQHPVSQSQDRLIAAYMRKLAELRMSQEADRSAPPAPAGEHSEQHNSDGNAAAPAASAYSWNLENLRMRHVTAAPRAPLPTAHKFASPIKLRDPCMFPPSPLLPWGQRLSHIHREQPAWLARASRQPASQL